jgi:hypothetical protein
MIHISCPATKRLMKRPTEVSCCENPTPGVKVWKQLEGFLFVNGVISFSIYVYLSMYINIQWTLLTYFTK